MNYIGVDVGASFIKGGLFDLKTLKISNVVKYPSPASSIKVNENKPLRFEVSSDLYLKKVRKIIKKILKIEPSIDGIVFSTQMHGCLFVDPQLNPVTPFIGWQDERMTEKLYNNKTYFDLIGDRLNGVDMSKTGITLRSGLMGMTLFWLKENKFFNKYPNAKAMFLGDFIAAKLSKGNLVCHSTNACGSALFNVEKNCWDKEILKKLEINESLLPDVVPLNTKVGFIKVKTKKIPVYVSVGDMQAAIAGSLIGLGKNRDICINIGTGSQVSTISNNFERGEFDVRSYFDNLYLNTITFIPAGRALNVVLNFIDDLGKKIFNTGEVDIWRKLTTLASNKKGSQGIQGDISFFKNSISSNLTGSFNGISEKNFTIDNLFFSALEAMAENYRKAYHRLGKTKSDNFITAGGLAKKIPALRALIEDKIGKKIEFAFYEEEALIGLFLISLVVSGQFSDIRDASLFLKERKLTLIK